MVTMHDSYVADNFEQVVEAFDKCNLASILEDAGAELYSMSRALHRAADAANHAGIRARGAGLRLIAEACSFVIAPDKPREPFGPVSVSNGRRTAVPWDFSDSEVGFLIAILDDVGHPALKGRLADVIWIRDRSRGVQYALTAIDSYRETGLEVETWFGGYENCWRRALGLARMIGKAAGERVSEMEAEIVAALKSSTTDDGFFAHILADVLQSNGLGTNEETSVAAKLESLAGEFGANGNFHSSQGFYSASSVWYRYSGNDDKTTDMTVAEAEAYVTLATDRLSSDRSAHGVAASFLENAVQVYRNIPRSQRSRHQVDQRVEELRLKISEYGARALDEMGTVASPGLDLTDHAERVRDTVRGKPVDQALVAFANLHQTKVEKLRTAAIDSLTKSPLVAHIPKVISSHDGRVIARTPGIRGTTPSEEDEQEVWAQMVRVHYQTLTGLIAQASILPALQVIVEEPTLQTAHLIQLARRSPIVPIGRKALFGKALAFGFDYDFATALQLLTPQIENLVRTHLKQAGVSTSHLDQDGIETENGLSALIDLPEVPSIFGEDLAFEIKALFCDQMGPNLRNNVAHGLFEDQQTVSPDSVYAWWLGFKLVFNIFWNSLGTYAESEGEHAEGMANQASDGPVEADGD